MLQPLSLSHFPPSPAQPIPPSSPRPKRPRPGRAVPLGPRWGHGAGPATRTPLRRSPGAAERSPGRPGLGSEHRALPGRLPAKGGSARPRPQPVQPRSAPPRPRGPARPRSAPLPARQSPRSPRARGTRALTTARQSPGILLEAARQALWQHRESLRLTAPRGHRCAQLGSGAARPLLLKSGPSAPAPPLQPRAAAPGSLSPAGAALPMPGLCQGCRHPQHLQTP